MEKGMEGGILEDISTDNQTQADYEVDSALIDSNDGLTQMTAEQSNISFFRNRACMKIPPMQTERQP